jgi:hypothetical protein
MPRRHAFLEVTVRWTFVPDMAVGHPVGEHAHHSEVIPIPEPELLTVAEARDRLDPPAAGLGQSLSQERDDPLACGERGVARPLAHLRGQDRVRVLPEAGGVSGRGVQLDDLEGVAEVLP